jgi:hypothetical protein
VRKQDVRQRRRLELTSGAKTVFRVKKNDLKGRKENVMKDMFQKDINNNLILMFLSDKLECSTATQSQTEATIRKSNNFF